MSGHRVRSENQDDALQMLEVFRRENRDSSFDWNDHYGAEFNTINLKMLGCDDPTASSRCTDLAPG